MIIFIMAQYSTKSCLFPLVFFALIGFFLPSNVSADDRTENIDVFLVVDKSLSMEEEIGAVKEYLRDSVVDELLIPGDNLVVIVFYGSADILMAEPVPSVRSAIHEKIAAINADGRFTDIGNALDVLRTAISENENDNRRKYLLLITDGIQEAPPESVYYSPDGSFNHEFLQNTKEILKEGWKIHILGIGSATAAREIADELSGTFSEVPEAPSKEELDRETKEFLGVIERIGDITMRAIGRNGNSELKLTLVSSGYASPRSVSVRRIMLEMPDGSEQSVLLQPVEVKIDPDATADLSLPVGLDTLPAPGRYSGKVTFSFSGDTVFTPAVGEVEYRIRGFFGNNVWWIVPVIVLGAALLALLVFFLRRFITGGGTIHFLCIIDDSTVRKRQYKLRHSGKLYLVEGMMGLTVAENPGAEPAAEITADSMGLHLTILDEKGYTPSTPIPVDVLGQEIVLVKKYGKKAKLRFEKP